MNKNILIVLLCGMVTFVDGAARVNVFFRSEILKCLRARIASEYTSIMTAMYICTHPEIAQALKEASGRGVKIDCLFDSATASIQNNQIKALLDSKISVYQYNNNSSGSIMHNKFFLFKNNCDNFSSSQKESIVFTGSCNATREACASNCENMIEIISSEVYEKFLAEWHYLKNKSVRLTTELDQHAK